MTIFTLILSSALGLVSVCGALLWLMEDVIGTPMKMKYVLITTVALWLLLLGLAFFSMPTHARNGGAGHSGGDSSYQRGGAASEKNETGGECTGQSCH